MDLLTFDTLLNTLAPYANRDSLTPQEASTIQLLITELLTDHYVDFPILKFLSRFLTQQAYEEIIEERNIEHLCGYITCNSSPKQQVRRRSSTPSGTVKDMTFTKFQIYNRKPSIILPNTYLSQYCCKDHYQASIFYRNQISNEALFARKDILTAPPFPPNYPATWYENGITCLEEVLAKHKELKEQGKSLRDVISMLSGLSVGEAEESRETSELIQLLNDFEIVEKEGGLKGDDATDTAAGAGTVSTKFNAVNEIDQEDDEGDEGDDDDDEDTGDGYGKSSKDRSRGIEGYITTDKYFGGYVV